MKVVKVQIGLGNIVAGILFAVLSTHTMHANAQLVRVEFTGDLQSITTLGVPGNPALEALFTIGDSVSGFVEYRTDDNEFNSLQFFELTVGSYTATSTGGQVIVRNDHQAGSTAPFLDSIIFLGDQGLSAGIGGLNLTRLQFAVGSADLSKLTSTNIPSAAEVNSLEDFFEGNVNFAAFDNDGILRYQLDNFNAQGVLVVSIDIKPGSDPNAINSKSKGVIPLAVLGSLGFDATQVDYSTVAFGSNEAPSAHDGHVVDLNGDGFADILFHFRTQETGLSCGDNEAVLTGMTFGGESIRGTDSLKIVGCN